MNPRELVDHVRSGLAELELVDPLRFRRRTRSNPCDFDEFLQALQSSGTIRDVNSGSQLHLGISEHEWVLLIKILGRIKDIQHLAWRCSLGSRDFHPFQAMAEAVNSAQSLRKLYIGIYGETFPRDPSGINALVNALREHTTLQELNWMDWCPLLEASHSTTLDHVLRSLQACPRLRKLTIMAECASADAMKNLLQLQSATELHLLLKTDQWLAVADEIRRGRCNVRILTLTLFVHRGTTSDATESVKALASAIRLDQNLRHLTLDVEGGFTDGAGVALAEALTVNTTLWKIILSDDSFLCGVHYKATLGAQAYEAFSTMLRVNTNLALKLPLFEYRGADERLRRSREQMRIEQRLNQVGRGRLLSSTQTTREEYVDALHELNSNAAYCDLTWFQLGCVYSLLRLNPSVVSMS
jgi:hypothetical protein